MPLPRNSEVLPRVFSQSTTPVYRGFDLGGQQSNVIWHSISFDGISDALNVAFAERYDTADTPPRNRRGPQIYADVEPEDL